MFQQQVFGFGDELTILDGILFMAPLAGEHVETVSVLEWAPAFRASSV
jgi:hypothetical protein